MSTERPFVVTPKFVLGVFVLIAGILLTLDSLNLVDTSRYFRFWPAVLIGVGAVVFTQARGGHDRGKGALIVLAGVVLMLGAFDIIEVRFWELFWPGVMIVAGGSLIMQTLRRHRGPSLDPSESVSSFTFMGGVKRTSNANPFRHSDLTAIWGGCDLDLRQATIPPGEEAAIDVFALMGGHKSRVPEEWAVDSRVFPFMGGVDDKTTPAADASAPRLVVRGAIIMGGLHLSN